MQCDWCPHTRGRLATEADAPGDSDVKGQAEGRGRAEANGSVLPHT